ncbi:hypothetical protein CYLTODRAFT_494686 [Cylindrobasidium torrendii FP15055 ss-10]|uniref:Uncharacterized protein n=1 Tax=Cylindrobasidium torrendii FP15055 ss-10 TaxID=1314674 RepID=A0A0D7AVF5_9AGAR|nr:hypothetical protein CYLTODRAFT_494686 [Cylindrobasidium torrendii FP15055 ss-10]
MSSYHSIRLALYGLSFASAVASAGVCINMLVKQHNFVAYMTRTASEAGVSIEVDTRNILQPAIAATIFSILTIVLAPILVLGISRPRWKTKTALKNQGWLLVVLSLGLYCSAIPLSIAVRARTIEVSGSTQSGVSLEYDDIMEIFYLLGVDPEYRETSYFVLSAIFPWCAWLFCWLSCIATFSAVSSASTSLRTIPMSQIS